mmetsp:Transcript_3527/g.6010  ORF Transcript_3527/g.6010 Transcript_3527/m.6010 type:complete len:232 (+) Transcript_3527:1952-2647(+)
MESRFISGRIIQKPSIPTSLSITSSLPPSRPVSLLLRLSLLPLLMEQPPARRTRRTFPISTSPQMAPNVAPSSGPPPALFVLPTQFTTRSPRSPPKRRSAPRTSVVVVPKSVPMHSVAYPRNARSSPRTSPPWSNPLRKSPPNSTASPSASPRVKLSINTSRPAARSWASSRSSSLDSRRRRASSPIPGSVGGRPIDSNSTPPTFAICPSIKFTRGRFSTCWDTSVSWRSS